MRVPSVLLGSLLVLSVIPIVHLRLKLTAVGKCGNRPAASERYTEDVEPEQIIGTILPHSSFGDLACCDCLNGFVRGDQADIVCNECNVVIRNVVATEIRKTFTEMELTLDLCSAECPHCGNGEPVPRIFADHVVYV